MEEPKPIDLEALSRELAASSRRANRRAVLLVVVPFLVGLTWLLISGYQASKYADQAARAKISLQQRKDSLNTISSLIKVLALERDSVAKNLDSVKLKNAQISNVLTQNNDSSARSSGRKIVFIQVISADSRPVAESAYQVPRLRAVIGRNPSYIVPEAELVPKSTITNSIYYYHAADSAAARNIAGLCEKFYAKPFLLKSFSRKKFAKVPAGQIEIWVNNQK